MLFMGGCYGTGCSCQICAFCLCSAVVTCWFDLFLFLDGGEIRLIRSNARRERDYDLALRTGLFALAGQIS